MARSRSLKPGFFTNEQLAECSHYARLLFTGLWCLADRAGKLRDRPRKIKAELFPYEPGPDVEPQIAELARVGLVVRYEVDGEQFIKIPGFEKHQNPHPREPKSEIPEPCTAAASREKVLPGPAGSSLSPFPIPLAVPAAAADAGTAREPEVWETFRDLLADRMVVPRDWLKVASAERAGTVREQINAEVTRLGLPRALEVAAEAATKAKSKPRWLAYFVGALQDARRNSSTQDDWQDAPRSTVWRDEQGRTLAELQSQAPQPQPAEAS